MKKFINDIKKYRRYILYATKAELNAEVANSYLGALWWVLDPLFFMLIYTFISVVVFKSSEQYFPVFVFIGLTIWNFFNKVLTTAPRLVQSNKDIVTKVYIPKYILLIEKICVNGFKMFISLLLVIVMMLIYQVPVSLNVFFLIPIFITLFVITFAASTILMHFGVFVEDLSNFTVIFLRLVFYLSGIFYLVSTRLPSPYNGILLSINPIAYLIENARNALLYAKPVDPTIMIVWFIIGIIISYIGIKIIYKYENSYVKVIK